MKSAARDLLLALVDEGFDHRSWHGTTLRGSIRGLNGRTAGWRPQRGRHNIWEIVVHCAYWKHAVQRRLTAERRGRFGISGSNWFASPDVVTDAAWRDAVERLDTEHRALRAAIVQLRPASLSERTGAGRFTHAGLIRGIAAHDLYHAGQIQLLKRLQRSST